MNLNLGEIFYNSIPGGVFIYIWYRIFFSGSAFITNEIKNNESISLTLFILLSVLAGFIMQAIWKIIRKKCCIDKSIIDELKEEYKKKDIKSVKKLDKEKIFDIQSKIWFDNKQQLIEFFSSRAAFFGNIVVGSTLTILFFIFLSNQVASEIKNKVWIPIISIVSAICFLFVYKSYKKNSYDTSIRQANNADKTMKEILGKKPK